MFSRKSQMITAVDALAGRAEQQMTVPEAHHVNGHPLTGPWPDGYQTAVVLDGTASADPLDDPGGQLPLTYAWEILDDESRFEDSRATSPSPTIRLRGDRPATIILTVTDRDGLEAVAVDHVQLTVR